MSGCPFSPEQIGQLKAFISACQAQPSLIHNDKLDFFKNYLMSLGAVLPPAPVFTSEPSGDSNPAHNEKEKADEPPVISEDEEESDVELDMEGVIESLPLDANQEMGDLSKETTEEERDQSDEKRCAAVRAFSEQQFDEAIKLYSEAIVLNPQSALLFAKRGQVYLKLNKLLACIEDCTHALELNCDSAAAYKFRGRAYRLLGKFEEASHDLCESLKIDYDDQTNEWLQEVKPNAEKLRQHKLSTARKAQEISRRHKIQAAKKAQEAHKAARAAAEAAAASLPDGFPGPGGFSGTGIFPEPSGFPGAGAEMGADFMTLLMDPEIIETLKDPEVQEAFMDVSRNPTNFIKYQDNPKVAAAIEKMKNKFGNIGSFRGEPDAPTAPADKPADKPADNDDVGLD